MSGGPVDPPDAREAGAPLAEGRDLDAPDAASSDAASSDAASSDAASSDAAAPDPRWSRVDELFAGEPPPPPVEVGPRLRRLRLLLGVALFLDVVGLLLTVVPGAVLTVWAWLSADAEAARVEVGTYDEASVVAVTGMRNVARAAMIFCVVCLIAQAWALHNGLYDGLWAWLYDLFSGMVGRLLA